MLGNNPKQLRVSAFARAVIFTMLAACALLAGPSTSAQENDDARALNIEAERLYYEGRYDEAIPLAERSLAIREKAFGPEHPNVAKSLNTLALLYKAKILTSNPDQLMWTG